MFLSTVCEKGGGACFGLLFLGILLQARTPLFIYFQFLFWSTVRESAVRGLEEDKKFSGEQDRDITSAVTQLPRLLPTGKERPWADGEMARQGSVHREGRRRGPAASACASAAAKTRFRPDDSGGLGGPSPRARAGSLGSIVPRGGRIPAPHLRAVTLHFCGCNTHASKRGFMCHATRRDNETDCSFI